MTIAAVVGIVSTVVGTSAAIGLSRVPSRWANAVNFALCFPIMLPGLVIGIALFSFFVSVGLQLSLRTVMLSHIVITQPYVILVVYARMANFDYTLVESVIGGAVDGISDRDLTGDFERLRSARRYWPRRSQWMTSSSPSLPSAEETRCLRWCGGW